MPGVSERRLRDEIARVQQGHVKYRDKLRAEGKLFVRDRLSLLLDPGTEFQEDWLLARSAEPETPADGVVTGVGTVLGRPVCVMANDFTVKAGSWGEKTVQKIVRIQEKAARLRIPLVYLVDAAGGRISEQIRIFPGRYHAGRIFYNEVQLSGVVPQVCILFGPSPAGSAYLPALTDVVIMVEGKASMYVGSPRMVEMAIGEKIDHEALGGARMHCEESGCGDVLAGSDEEAIAAARRYLAYMPQSHRDRVPDAAAARSGAGTADRRDRALRPAEVLRHARGHPRARGRGLVARDQGALRAGDHHGLRAARRAARSGSSPTSPRSRAACSSSTPPTRRRGSSGSATRTTSPSSTSPTSRDSWSARRSSGRGSSATAPR